jgi:hypothetical protein
MIDLENLFVRYGFAVMNSVIYLAIAVACVSYLNRVHAHKISHSFAFGLTAAGAFGSLIDLWRATPSMDGEWHLMFRAGVAAIAVLHFGLDRRRSGSVCAPQKHEELPDRQPGTFERRFNRVH